WPPYHLPVCHRRSRSSERLLPPNWPQKPHFRWPRIQFRRRSCHMSLPKLRATARSRHQRFAFSQPPAQVGARAICWLNRFASETSLARVRCFRSPIPEIRPSELLKFRTRSSRARIQPSALSRSLQANRFHRGILRAAGRESRLRRTKAIPKEPNPPLFPAVRRQFPIRAGLRRNCKLVFARALQPQAAPEEARLELAPQIPAST